MRNLTLGGVLGRFLASLVLVMATFNPTGYSSIHWDLHEFSAPRASGIASA